MYSGLRRAVDRQPVAGDAVASVHRGANWDRPVSGLNVARVSENEWMKQIPSLMWVFVW